MHVRVLFFALYRDLAGTGEIMVELPPGATTSTLVHIVRGLGGGLDRLPESPVVAVNHEYAPLGTPLHDGDEIAFLPPVAGG